MAQYGNFDIQASEVQTSLSRKGVLKQSPGTEAEKVKDIVNAAEEHSWTQTSGLGVNEKEFFEEQYKQLAYRYYMEAGETVTHTFNRFKNIIEGIVLKLVKEDKGGTFKGKQASGGQQFLIRPIVPDTLGLTEASRSQSTGATGKVNNYLGTVTPKTNKAEDENEFVIFGLLETTDPTVVISAIDEIDDTIGERAPVDVYNSVGMTDTQFIPYSSVVYVQNDDTYNMDIIAAKNAETDLFPVGVDIITEAQLGP